MSATEQMDAAFFYDATLRFKIQSGSDPHVQYMIELDSFDGNGECDCPNFGFPTVGYPMSKRECCAKRISPEDAVKQRLVPSPKNGRVSDALRCKHIVDARDQLASAVIRALVKAEKAKK